MIHIQILKVLPFLILEMLKKQNIYLISNNRQIIKIYILFIVNHQIIVTHIIVLSIVFIKCILIVLQNIIKYIYLY